MRNQYNSQRLRSSAWLSCWTASQRALDPIKHVQASAKSSYAGRFAWLGVGDRPSPDRCDSDGGCYSWKPYTYPGGRGGRDSRVGRAKRNARLPNRSFVLQDPETISRVDVAS
ncbi:hypothetical protein VC83_06749 [Pseudogymnoascus destructans]|uniref:Uncharacterized protein n=1 Tax=Pseudogymnoascus destructans TaxID=655981 RepID=A0A177A4E1_9PEZI|nr:uncharacterized protein VC83_06749 [Pseudogymnoascus destructans]OAF56470.1 hypothetical protein VC83_06749 [Pseudogymnoascus destructans]